MLAGDHALFCKTKTQIEQQQQLQMTSTKEELKIVKYQRPDSSTGLHLLQSKRVSEQMYSNWWYSGHLDNAVKDQVDKMIKFTVELANIIKADEHVSKI